MGFFSEEQKNDVAQGKFELGGGLLIPDDTTALGAIDEIKWTEWQDERYINARWCVLAPENLKNRKIFQKIKVANSDQKAQDRAKRMLAAIDMNAGGHLMEKNEEPTDEDLMRCLANKPMMIKVRVWELDDKSKKGNWIAAVAPRTAKEPVPEAKVVAAKSVEEMDDAPF